jgi:hypothetical protein
MVQGDDADCVDRLDRRWLGGGSTPPPVSYPLERRVGSTLDGLADGG